MLQCCLRRKGFTALFGTSDQFERVEGQFPDHVKEEKQLSHDSVYRVSYTISAVVGRIGVFSFVPNNGRMFYQLPLVSSI